MTNETDEHINILPDTLNLYFFFNIDKVPSTVSDGWHFYLFHFSTCYNRTYGCEMHQIN